MLVYIAAVVVAVGGAAMAALAPQATVGTVSPIVIAIGLGGVILVGPQLTVDDATPLTLTAWSASGVAALALTGVALSVLRVDLAIPNIGLAYLLWIPTIALSYFAIAGANRRFQSRGESADPPKAGLRLAHGTAYLAASLVPAFVVVLLLLGAQPREGPTLAVWILPATGGVAGDLNVRPGASYDLIGAVQADRAGDRRVELVIDLAGVEMMHTSFAASETPAPFTSGVTVPPDASGSVPVVARARFAGEPSSEVTAVLRLLVSP